MATVCGNTLSSACILICWFLWDISGWGGGAFPPTNDSAQVRLRALQSTATGCHPDLRSCKCGQSTKKRQYSNDAKRQMDKTWSRVRVSLGLAFRRSGACTGEAGESDAGVGLLYGRVGG